MTSSIRNRKPSAARRSLVGSPAMVEVLEQKLLLTTPELITPMGTISGPSAVAGAEREIEFNWNAVDNAESYEIWVSSLNTYKQIVSLTSVDGISANIPVSDLAQGGNRIWVRANLEDGSTSDWSSPVDVTMDLTASVTGPVGVTGRNVIEDTTPVVTWASASELSGFQLWLTDLNSGEIRRYDAPNILVDGDGEPVLDDDGHQIPAERRAYEIQDELPIGSYRVWVRGIESGGTLGDWSRSYDFQIGGRPTDLAPGYEAPINNPRGADITHQPTFDRMPRLTWDAVAGATNYEVWVATDPGTGRQKLDFGDAEDENGRVITVGTAFRIPTALRGGDYVFWVRALVQTEDGSDVVGAWSDPSKFSTIEPPVILGPVTDSGIVVERNPTITWNKIHTAAAYEVQVRRQDSPPPYLQETTNQNSLTLNVGLIAGNYTVWVRAIGGDGVKTSWSDALFFEATGGRPVVEINQFDDDPFFPEITWEGYEAATSYDIFVSYVGVDYEFITQSITDTVGDSDVVVTSYIHGAPLEEGEYRVWVRAILPTGQSDWSMPVTFTVASVEQSGDRSEEDLILLTSLEAESVDASSADASVEGRDIPPVAGPEIHVAEAQKPVQLKTDTFKPVEASDEKSADEVLQELAQNCVTTEWWEAPQQS